MGRMQIIWSPLVVAVTTATTLLVWSNVNRYVAADQQVVIAREAQRRLYEMTIILQDCENGARGFMLTAQPRFDQIFNVAAAELPPRLDSAQQALAGIQLDELFRSTRTLISSRLDLLRQMITLTQGGKPQEAAKMLESEATERLGADVRQAMLDLIHQTNSILEDRLAICRRSTRAMTTWVMTGLVALALSSIGLVLLMWRDICRQRQLSTELINARDQALTAVRTRDEFLNALSHELRTPLTPALLYVSGLEKRSEPGSDQREELTMIRRQLELEARLIDDLLDVSRILRGEVILRTQRVSIHALLQQAIAALEPDLAERGVTIRADLSASADIVMGAESRLHQVFWHLLNNAMKFTPSGGQIAVATTDGEKAIRVTITDSGVGMTKQQLATIFDAFVQLESSRTRRFGGLGVGLAIVKSVVELHMGSVRAESDGIDRGARIYLEFPVAG